jgi:methionyl-tRNA synthetase
VLYNLAETLRLCTVLLTPFMPTATAKIFDQLGVSADGRTWESAEKFGVLPADAELHKGENLFPRIDAAKELAELDAIQEAKKAAATPKEEKPELPKVEITDREPEISFDDFCKVELRVCKIIACENIKESKKLLKLTVYDGEKERCIMSGIAKWYKPDDLIGKNVGVVMNLAPRAMMGGKYTSEGMIFAADTEDGAAAIAFYPDSTLGKRIH